MVVVQHQSGPIISIDLESVSYCVCTLSYVPSPCPFLFPFHFPPLLILFPFLSDIFESFGLCFALHRLSKPLLNTPESN